MRVWCPAPQLASYSLPEAHRLLHLRPHLCLQVVQTQAQGEEGGQQQQEAAAAKHDGDVTLAAAASSQETSIALPTATMGTTSQGAASAPAQQLR